MHRAKLEESQEKPSDKDFRGHQKMTEEALNDLENGVFQELPRFEGFFRS
jgi:hypothetical protein